MKPTLPTPPREVFYVDFHFADDAVPTFELRQQFFPDQVSLDHWLLQAMTTSYHPGPTYTVLRVLRASLLAFDAEEGTQHSLWEALHYELEAKLAYGPGASVEIPEPPPEPEPPGGAFNIRDFMDGRHEHE